ncbi:MAG: methyltransferase domain-containing protein [Actinobacteria bacterium]|nr:methyltransferase domain-containing protein [Actinomycetota bacterium]MCG2817642.1 methyltransferase domain-containing protein [Actinomycetes bacterium]MBU4358512.1 methyltransferase domain-containing protein [Actinomycetota bacterium]MBU4393096.1 methyltransferase domain-containing protein [Actinomycetota bacterium]MBU4403671.1 methyltransferase domain-containing protein [Actinomycetota bacterium]
MDDEYYSYVINWFNRWAHFYDVTDLFLSGVREQVVEIADPVEGSTVLDVATGTGKQAFAFARRGLDVTGLDLSESMLGVARKKNRYTNARFLLGDATDLPFDDGTLDITTVSFALHDMPPEIREGLLDEMVRVTRRGGTVVVVDYDLPRNKAMSFIIYNFIKLYESRYYPEFTSYPLSDGLVRRGIEIETESTVLRGAGRVLKGKRT